MTTRKIMVSICAMASATFGCSSRAVAQEQRPLDAITIAGIVDDAISVLLPPQILVGRVPAEKRTIHFDRARTIAAFARQGVALGQNTSLVLRTKTQDASAAILDDCKELGGSKCAQLGWGLYAWAQPVAMSQTRLQIRLHVLWAGRSLPFVEGVAPTGTAHREGYLADLYFVRTPSGLWKFEKRGLTVSF